MSRVLDWRGHAWIALPLRVYLGVVFLMACWFKIADPASFALDVATYQILPLPLINLQALILPWIELAAGLMLITGLWTRPAALLVTSMMVMFIVALSLALFQGLEMGCGCFASEGGEDPISWRTLVRDGLWLAMASYVLVLDRRPLGLDRVFHRRRNHGT
jgi:uncharacterized membrane protein YphA (DoxX/SURF4 family)